MRTRSPTFKQTRRLHRHADPAGRSRRDHVARLEREPGREVLDQREAVEDQVLRVRVLAQLVVHPGAQAQAVGIADLVGSRDPGPDRAVRVERFPHRPRRNAELPVAHADVVHDQVAGDRLVRAGARDVAAAAADHEAELALVIERLRDARHVHGIARTRHAGRLLVEDDRELRCLESGLGDVVGVVEADRKELWRAQDRRAQRDRCERDPALRIRGRARGAAQRIRPGREQRGHLARQLGRGGREIDDVSVRDDSDARALLVDERAELHRGASFVFARFAFGLARAAGAASMAARAGSSAPRRLVYRFLLAVGGYGSNAKIRFQSCFMLITVQPFCFASARRASEKVPTFDFGP